MILQKPKDLADEKPVLCLMSDCLGSNIQDLLQVEFQLKKIYLKLLKMPQQAVYMTAISSNIGRFQQMINVAKKINRKVVFVGRSIQRKIEIAHELGIFKISTDQIIDLKRS